MKNLIFTCLLGLMGHFAFAQNVTLNGTVTDAQGKPIAFVFIKDAAHNYVTFTDSFGNFSLKVDTADRLIATAFNYKAQLVKVSNPQSVNFSMVDDGTHKTQINSGDFAEHISTEGMTKSTATGYIAKENTVHGSRYFLDKWAHGYVLTTGDSIKQNINYQFNYQKLDGSVLFTDDGKQMKEIDRGIVKRFALYDDQSQAFLFEKVAEIDPTHFVMVISAGSKYKIYKKLGTVFIANNYVSNGMTSTGNNYDEIKDEPTYYVVKVPNGAAVNFTLKNKEIKAAFAADAAKVAKYLSDHDSDIDDAYLKDLGDYLNN
jgi:hypothetical protein